MPHFSPACAADDFLYCQGWVENNISLEQVIDRTKFIADVHPAFWAWLRAELDTAKQKGWLR